MAVLFHLLGAGGPLPPTAMGGVDVQAVTGA
jgi:hypothetical protein